MWGEQDLRQECLSGVFCKAWVRDGSDMGYRSEEMSRFVKCLDYKIIKTWFRTNGDEWGRVRVPE